MAESAPVMLAQRLVAIACVLLCACAAQKKSEADASKAECTLPTDCPGMDTTCTIRTCDSGSCGEAFADRGTSCSESNGNFCDGMGACVECVDINGCAGDDVCDTDAGVCVPKQCANNVKDGNETDVDCGGPTCAKCGPGQMCSLPADCDQSVCQNNICQSSSCGDGVIQAGEDCDDGNKNLNDNCPDGPNGSCKFADCGDGYVYNLGTGSEECDGNGTGQGGETASCNANCSLAECGDGIVNATANEACDDGNNNDNDDCLDGPSGMCVAATCSDGVWNTGGATPETTLDCGGGCPPCAGGATLLLSEFVAAPTEAEFVEIHNPTASSVSLNNVYLADYNTYYDYAQGTSTSNSSDFIVSFPSNATIPANGRIVISLESASDFNAAYGSNPDYDFDDSDAGAPAMNGTFSNNSGLTNNGEMLVLFQWDGVSDLVTDLDYVAYGSTSQAMDKSGVTVGGSTYQNETPVGQQHIAAKPATGNSAARCGTNESGESQTGGNGVGGADETSENLSTTWSNAGAPTPGAASNCP